MPQTPGTYQFRFFLGNGYTRLAASQVVMVGTAASASNIPASDCNSFTGQWENDKTHDVFSLTAHSDGTGAGSYINPTGKITGRVSRNRFDGQWISGEDSGTFRFTLSADGQRIEGAWFKANGSFGASWNATRMSPCGRVGGEVSTTGCNSFTGQWENDTHDLIALTVDNNGTVTGRYTNPNGRITGRVSGNQLYGQWISGNSSGLLRFTLSADGQRIGGAWYQANGGFGASWNATRMSRCVSTGTGQARSPLMTLG